MLRDHLEHDQRPSAATPHGSFGQMLRDPKVYSLALVYFLLLGATYTIVFWLPTLIKSWGVNDLFMIGIYAAIPNVVRRHRHGADRPQLRPHAGATLALRGLRR